MSLEIDQYFPKIERADWIQTLLSTLKLSDEAKLAKYLETKSLEGVSYKLAPLENKARTLNLKSFPKAVMPAELQGDDYIDFYGIFEKNNCEEKKSFILIEKELQQSEKSLLIDTNKIHNAGGSSVQELLFALAFAFKAHESLNLAKRPLTFNISLDSNFFMNIAKLRALRYLFETVLEQNKIESHEFTIVAHSSLREVTLFDAHNNMLRTSIGSASAFIGGADYINTHSFDAIFEEDSALGKRQAVNTFHVLNEESSLGFVQDAAKGSQAIDDLTYQLVENTFEQLKDLATCSLKEITDKLAHQSKNTAEQRAEEVHTRKKTICGINNFADPNEILKTSAREVSESKLFPLRRSSEALEKLCMDYIEKLAARDPIIIIYHGEFKKVNARLNFCRNYFELIGSPVEVYDSKEKIDLILKDHAAVVFCAADSDYPDLLDRAELHHAGRYYIAGNKFKHEKALNLFQGQNVYEVLEDFVSGVVNS